MKKAILGLLSVGAAASALAQGTVTFENAASFGTIRLNSSSGAYAAVGSFTVALLWANSASTVPQASLSQIATYVPNAAAGDGFGQFYGPTVTTPSGSGTMVFEVEAWYGNFANYAAAVAGGSAFVGQTAEFLNATGTVTPPGPVPNLAGSGGTWDGNMVMVSVPEPGTLALGGLGAAALLFFRRRK